MKYRIEITWKDGEEEVMREQSRGQVRDKVDSVLFNLNQRTSRIESIYIRFCDGTKVVVIEE